MSLYLFIKLFLYLRFFAMLLILACYAAIQIGYPQCHLVVMSEPHQAASCETSLHCDLWALGAVCVCD